MRVYKVTEVAGWARRRAARDSLVTPTSLGTLDTTRRPREPFAEYPLHLDRIWIDYCFNMDAVLIG